MKFIHFTITVATSKATHKPWESRRVQKAEYFNKTRYFYLMVGYFKRNDDVDGDKKNETRTHIKRDN